MKQVNQLYENVIKLLKENNCSIEEFYHDPVYTTKQACDIIEQSDDNGIKSIVLQSKKGLYVFTTIGSERIDFKLLKFFLADSKISMCRDIYGKLGIEVGAVSPFGYDKHIILVIDERVFASQYVYINPGVNHISIKIKSSDLRNIMELSQSFFYSSQN